MRIALIHCPYFTNGDSPPLGLAVLYTVGGPWEALYDGDHRKYGA